MPLVKTKDELVIHAGGLVYDAMRNSRDGKVSIDVGVTDGVVRIAVPGCDEHIIVAEGEGVTIDFQVVGVTNPDVPIRYSVRR